MNRLLFLILMLAATATVSAQTVKPTGAKSVPKNNVAPVKPVAATPPPLVEEKVHINWMTAAEAAEKMKTQKRKIFVDVYTDWCGWCKKMEQTTFEDRVNAKYINENYYPVRFDAEQTGDVVWNGKTYKSKPSGGGRGVHELAAEWLGGRMSYPTTVYIDEDLNLIQAIPGYLDAEKFEAIINYFGSNNHKKTPWETYQKNFVSLRH